MGWIGVTGWAMLAFGQGPRSFDGAFEVARCADGWAACHVDGDPVDTLVVGRVDWGELRASEVFSPFVDLARLPRGSARVEPPRAPAPRVAPAAPVPPSTPPQQATAAPTPQPASPPVDCALSPELEQVALLGALPPAVVACLASTVATADRMTQRRAASVVLMTDAVARGDEVAWEALARRHFAEIDASDPAVALRMSRWLARRGEPLEAHRMAGLALENAHVWTGDVYRDRRASLLKLRSVAARDLWQAAEAEAVATPSAAAQARVERARVQAKVDALEWLGFLRDVGADDAEAQALCASAAGHPEACR